MKANEPMMTITQLTFRGDTQLTEELVGVTNTTEQAIEVVENGAQTIPLEDFITKWDPEFLEGETVQYGVVIHAILEQTEIRYEFRIQRMNLHKILNRIIASSSSSPIAQYASKY